MALSAAVATGYTPPGLNETQTYTSDGFGTPTAAVIFINYTLSTSATVNDTRIGVGFWDGTNNVAVAIRSDDAAGSGADTREQNDGAGAILRSDNRYAVTATTNGIQLEQIAGTSTGEFAISVLLLKGVSNAAAGAYDLGTSTTSQTINLGWRANCVLAACVGLPGGDGSTTNSILSFGAATIADDGTVVHRMVSFDSENSADPTDTSSYFTTSAISGQAYNGNVSWLVAVEADNSGFIFDTTASAVSDYIYYLALQLPDADDVYLDQYTAPTSGTTPLSESKTGAGFQPQALLTFASRVTTNDSLTDGASLQFGLTDGTVSRVLGGCMEHNVGTTNTQSYRTDGLIAIRDDDGTDLATATIDTLDSDGWTVDWSTVPTSAYIYNVLAFGDSTDTAKTPTGLTTSNLTTTGFRASWSNAGNPGGTTYNVEVQSYSAGTWSAATSASDVEALFYDFSSLTAETAYRWRVQAEYSGTTSDWSAYTQTVTADLTSTAYLQRHLAHAAAILSYDATGYTYETEVVIRKAGRHAIGFMLLQTDDGDQVRVSVDGSSSSTRTVDDDKLSNKFGSYFEDGVIHTFSTPGVYTLLVESVSNASVLKGVVVREPDPVSGVVVDQGEATHCEPLECVYGGSVYRVHVELYTGDVSLSIDGAYQGIVFSGEAASYNEKYHCGAFCVAMSGGVAVGQVGHNTAGIRVRYMPSGAYGNISTEYEAQSGTTFSYAKVALLSDDRLAISTRAGSGQDACLMLMSDVDQIGGTGASSTIDIPFIAGGTTGAYPNAFACFESGGTEVLAFVWNVRDGSGNWGPVYGALFCPSLGTDGLWYSLDGDSATVTDALGTTSAPRFSNTLRDTATGSGGIRILADAGSGQQYALSALLKVTQWPDESTAAKGAALVTWTTSAGALNDLGTSYVRFGLQYEGTFTADTSFNATPVGTLLESTHNNYRLDATWFWLDDDTTGSAILAITDRGTLTTTSGDGATEETTNAYYDWGAKSIKVLRAVNPMTPASISWSQLHAATPSGDYAAAFITYAGNNKVIWQTGEDQLHATHRQSLRESYTIGAAASLVPRSPISNFHHLLVR